MATIAVFIVLGGGAYAAFRLPANSVRSKHIVNGQVKSADAQDNGLTGVDVDEGTLGQVPQAFSALNAQSSEHADNASLLEGSDSTVFVRGGQSTQTQIRDGRVSIPYSSGQNVTVQILSVPGFGSVELGCQGSGAGTPAVASNFTNQSGTTLDSYRDDGSANPSFEQIPHNQGQPSGFTQQSQAGDLATDRIVWQLVDASGGVATITASVRIQQTASTHVCYGVAHAVARAGT